MIIRMSQMEAQPHVRSPSEGHRGRKIAGLLIIFFFAVLGFADFIEERRKDFGDPEFGLAITVFFGSLAVVGWFWPRVAGVIVAVLATLLFLLALAFTGLVGALFFGVPLGIAAALLLTSGRPEQRAGEQAGDGRIGDAFRDSG